MPDWQGIAAHALRAGNTQTAVYFTKCAHHAARRAQQALLDSLEDERRSGLNALLSERVADGSFDAKRANLVEVNNVCDGGAALLAALRAVKRSS